MPCFGGTSQEGWRRDLDFSDSWSSPRHRTMNEVVEMLRGWRRSLRRAQELEIATPDATLLLGALDKMSELVGKTSNQVAFRMSSTRATLGVDVTPTLETVLSFSDMLTAEAESLAISDVQPPQEIKPSNQVTREGGHEGQS